MTDRGMYKVTVEIHENHHTRITRLYYVHLMGDMYQQSFNKFTEPFPLFLKNWIAYKHGVFEQIQCYIYTHYHCTE
jgi:hypothetical protein